MGDTNTFKSTYKGNPRLTGAGVVLRNGDFPNKNGAPGDSLQVVQIRQRDKIPNHLYRYDRKPVLIFGGLVSKSTSRSTAILARRHRWSKWNFLGVPGVYPDVRFLLILPFLTS